MELARFPSHGRFSVRSIFTVVLAAFTTVLLWILLSSTPVQAETTPATWTSSGAILYDTHGYNAAPTFNDSTGTIPNGSTVYQAPVQPGTSGSSTPKLLVLYFAPGVDPPTATTVKYVEFDYTNGITSNPQNQRDITLTPQGNADSTESSCSVSGIGWIICPVSVFLAEAMDNIFNILSGMIAVTPPILGDPNNSMLAAWNVTRAIANVAFVIAFLIIIYSQITSVGVSNYGIKKMIPRLIVAAVLVNISFYISALAIDISNIAGFSIQQIFNSIRESLFSVTNDNLSGLNTDISWATITSIVLAGGGMIGGLYFLGSGGLYLLIPLLLGLFLTVLFVVIVLAARQAIILLLVILAPLAFVANLLPNTESWYKKWQGLFMTMLIFFPAFSLVFGGSQLAGQLIIQNAGDNVITLIFGMAVQIAPLVITPILLKFSGGLLGRIAQIANDPRKGLLDRNKNWANERAELTKQKNLQKNIKPWNLAAGTTQAFENRRKRRKGLTEMYAKRADNKWHESRSYGNIHERSAEADLEKQTIENRHTAHIQGKANTRGSALNIKTLELENAKVLAEKANAQTGAILSGYRAGEYDTGFRTGEKNSVPTRRLAILQQTMAENVIQTSAWKQAEQNNQYLQQRNISTRMRTDQNLLDIAQGSGNQEMRIVGRERAEAAAVATLTKLNKDARDNVITLMQTKAVEAEMTVPHYAIERVYDLANNTNPAVRSSISKSQLEAALEIAVADGQMSIFDSARQSEFIDQEIVDAVVARNVPTFKQKGGFHTQKYPKLSIQRYLTERQDFEGNALSDSMSEEAIRKLFDKHHKLARLDTLSNTTAENFKDVKAGTFASYASEMAELLQAIPTDATGKPVKPNHVEMLDRIHEAFRGVLSDEQALLGLTDRLAPARAIEESLRQKFYEDVPPMKLPKPGRDIPGGGTRSPTDIDTDIDDVDPTAGSPSDAP